MWARLNFFRRIALIVQVAAAGRVRHAVTLWLAVAAVIAYLCRNCLVVAEKSLRLELELSEQQMGLILGPAFFWAYALAQIPTASLGERFGSRRCLPLLSAAWSVACGIVALASGFTLLLASRIGGGVAQAGLFPCAVRTISLWHPRDGRALASGSLGAAMSLGAAISVGVTGWLLQYLAATTIFALFAIPGLIWAVGFALWFRERPEQHGSVNPAELALIRGVSDASRTAAGGEPGEPGESATTTPERDRPATVADSAAPPGASRGRMWALLVTSPAAWLICGQQFFRAGGYAFFASWFATYLMETRGVTTAASGMLTAMPLVATVLGALSGGYASDAIFRATGSLTLARKGVAGASLGVCALLVLSAFFIADPTLAVLLISGGAFLAAVAGPCAYTVTMDMGSDRVASLFSTMNMIGNFGAGLTPWLVPQFKSWIDRSPTLLAWCDGNSWNAVLLLFASMYLGAALCWSGLSTRGTVFDQSLLRR